MSTVLRRTVLASMLAAALAVAPAAWADQIADFVVGNAWIRKPPPGLDTAAMYFTIQNSTKNAVVIVGVKTPVAAHAMIHETSVLNDQSRMRMKDTVTVPGGKGVAFAPEGLHVMLTGLTRTLEVGDKVPVTLELDHGGSIDIVATVRPLDTN